MSIFTEENTQIKLFDTFTISHLGEAFIQRELQMRTMEAIKINKRAINMQVL